MIRYLQIENFKSLRQVCVPTEQLNLLFGMNGMGKSSILQALSLLRQSYWANNQSNLDRLHINGELVSLGTGQDILSQFSESELIRFCLAFNGNESLDVSYYYEAEGKNKDLLSRVGQKKEMSDTIKNEALFDGDFLYLSAEHLGPQTRYPLSNWQADGIDPIGIKGQYAVPFLAMEGERFRVPDYMCLEKGKTNSLVDQLSAWMSEISPGVKLNASYLPGEETSKLDISYIGDRLETSAFTPINVGFGIPYVLPLIMGLLTSNEHSLLLLENPESHLHPRGQSSMGRLIAKAAASGAQIFCESHSDHIINGIRVAVKDGVLNEKDLGILYFDKNRQHETEIADIQIDRNGNLSAYPKGLLDEWGFLMSALL